MSAKPKTLPRKVLDLLSSFGLCCVILLFLFVLTFLGTLEQTEAGLYDVQRKYFESVFLVHWLYDTVPIPLPGADLLLGLLGINLVLGGLFRIRKSWATAGIIVSHVGILLMLLAGFVKQEFSVDGHLTLFEVAPPSPDELARELKISPQGARALILAQQRDELDGLEVRDVLSRALDASGKTHEQLRDAIVRKNAPSPERVRPDGRPSAGDDFVSYHEWEIAIWDASRREDVPELLIPGERFLGLEDEATRTFQSPDLPFSLELSHALRNCMALPKGPMWQPRYPLIDGYALKELDLAKENEQNVAGVYVTVHQEGEADRHAILWGNQRRPLAVTAGGKTWGVDLRKKRFKMPFAVALHDFTRELYPRTNMPKVFKSEVTVHEEGQPPRRVKIEMNAPLRYRGYTLFQASWGPGDARKGDPLFSTFAVVRNPSDDWPLYSCIVIAVGLLGAFSYKLFFFVRGQTRRRARDEQEVSS